MRHDQHLLLPCCCYVRVGVRCGLFFLIFCVAPRSERCVPFFLFFRIAPGGQKPRKSFFRKRPGIVVNAPGRLFSPFFTCKIVPPRGAFTRIVMASRSSAASPLGPTLDLEVVVVLHMLTTEETQVRNNNKPFPPELNIKSSCIVHNVQTVVHNVWPSS